jgi:hypothetical protein
VALTALQIPKGPLLGLCVLPFAALLTGLCFAQSAAPRVSVGRLLIPAIRHENGYARHYDEACSATLIAAEVRTSSRYLLSAWHCLADYSDLSRPIIFEHSSGRRLQAWLITSGGGMAEDWALLRLTAPLGEPTVLGSAPSGGTLVSTGSKLLMAGYPHDGNKPPKLAALRSCEVIDDTKRDIATNCVLSKGASGGAVFEAASAPCCSRYVGVISRGDGLSQSIFVPLARFTERLRGHMRTGS